MKFKKQLASLIIIGSIIACEKEATQEQEPQDIEYETISLSVFNQNCGVSTVYMDGTDIQSARDGEQRIITYAFNYETTDNEEEAIGHAKVSYRMSIPPYTWSNGQYSNVSSDIEIIAKEGESLLLGAVLEPGDLIEVNRDEIVRNKYVNKLTISNSSLADISWYLETLEAYRNDKSGVIELFYPIIRRSMQELLEGRKYSIVVLDKDGLEREVQAIADVDFYSDMSMTVTSEHWISEVNISNPVADYAIYKVGFDQKKIFFGKPK